MEITLCHGCSPGNLLHIFRTPFQKNTFGGLLLFDNRVIKNDIYMILPFIYKKSIVLSLRSSHRRNSLKKLFLKISQNSQENTCARASFLIKVFLHRCFPVNFANFLRTPFLQNTSGRLLRKHVENCYIKRHHVYFNLL